MDAANALKHRLLNALPARAYAMQALLRLTGLEVTRECPTARVTCGARSKLQVNPEFVEQHCASDEHLFLLVMHELQHILLGHTRLFRTVSPAHNIAFDAVINAGLMARFPGEAYASFFLALYGRDTGVLRILAPPAPGTAEAPEGALRELHELLYASGDVTAREVFDRLVQAIEEAGPRSGTGGGSCEETGRLLGDHGSGGSGGAGQEEGSLDAGDGEQELREEMERLASGWPGAAGGRGPVAGRGGELEEGRTRQADPAAQVLAALRRALSGGDVDRRSRRTRLVPGQRLSFDPVPHLRDRRAVAARAAGATVLLYETTTLHPRMPERHLTEIYLDVSGSVHSYLPYLYGALARLRALVPDRVHLFSTSVVTIPRAHLMAGRVATTGGTSIDCVLEHALRHDVRRAVLITDGFVGRAEESLVARIRQEGVDLRGLVTVGGTGHLLEGVARGWGWLPELTGGRLNRLSEVST